jgi:C-terminal peptidase prc
MPTAVVICLAFLACSMTFGQQPASPSTNLAAVKEPIAAPITNQALAEKAWTIMNAVEESHLQPPPLASMVEMGILRLYTDAKLAPPADLRKAAVKVKSPAQLLALIDPASQKAEGAARAKLQEAFLLQGIAAAVPGGFRLIEAPSKKEQAVQEQVNANRYIGIGIMLKTNEKEQRPEIASAMLHGAARNAGIKPKDVIESVDGKDTKGKPLAEVVDWLRGPEGSTVTTTVRQPGAESRTYKMVRAKVAFEHVFGFKRVGEEDFDFRVDPTAPIAYLRLGSYATSSLHELRQFERKLHAAGYRALVLDLRNSGGGSLQHAVLLGGGLLDGKLLWKIKMKNADEAQEYRADREALFRDWPIVALTGGRLDTATGLIAAALKDNGRATLVGEPINLDGYIRSMIELPGQKEALILPSGTLERPTAANGWPVKPDYLVTLTPEQRKAIGAWAQDQEVSDRPRVPKAKPPADPQLAKAVELLREALEKQKVTQK